MAEVLLRVSHLTKEFPFPGMKHCAPYRMFPFSGPRRNLWPGWRVGLRQIHPGAHHLRAVPPHRRAGVFRGSGNIAAQDLCTAPAAHCPYPAILFQDSMASLNPRQPIGALIEEPLAIHHEGTRRSRREKALGLMAQVGLDAALYDQYPAEFSGGMRQRVCIARALALSPRLIIADEPIASLDVSMQAQIINLFQSLCQSQGVSLLFIAHDLSMVRHISHRIGVMCRGRLVGGARPHLVRARSIPIQRLFFPPYMCRTLPSPKPSGAHPLMPTRLFQAHPSLTWRKAGPEHFVLFALTACAEYKTVRMAHTRENEFPNRRP